MTTEGFFALLALVFASVAGLSLARRHGDGGWSQRARRERLLRYHASGWASLALAGGVVAWLWGFAPDPPADGAMLLTPESWSWSFLLPFVFLFLGGTLALLLPMQLWWCGRLVFASPGRDPERRPSDPGRGGWQLAAFAVFVWLPALLGYEAMRGHRVEVGGDVLRLDPFWPGEVEERAWDDVVSFDYRPWMSRGRSARLHHGMAFVFADGSEWSLREDRYWGLDDPAVREQLRAMARSRGVEYRHGSVK